MLHAKNYEARNSASRFLARSTFSIEKVLHAKDHEAPNFQSNAPIQCVCVSPHELLLATTSYIKARNSSFFFYKNVRYAMFAISITVNPQKISSQHTYAFIIINDSEITYKYSRRTARNVTDDMFQE